MAVLEIVTHQPVDRYSMPALANRLTQLVNSLVVGGTTDTTRSTTETHPVPESLSVHGLNGSVAVTGTARDDVLLWYEKRGPSNADLDEVRVHTSLTDGELAVTVNHPARSQVSVSIELEIPRGLPLSAIRITNGSISVEGVGGNPELETKHGGITVERCDGFVDARSTNGSIEVRDAAGIDHAESTNGSLTLDIQAIRGETTIQTTTGGIDVRAGNLDATVSIETNVGSIDAPPFEQQSTGIGHTAVNGTLGTGEHTLIISNAVGRVQFRTMDEHATP